MEVALVASLVAPIRAAEANGPHSVIVDLAHGLAARGHGVRIYAAAGSHVEGVEVKQVVVEAIAQEAALRVDGPSPGAARAAIRRGFVELYHQLRRDRPDAISQHAFDAPAIELAGRGRVLHTLHLPPLSDEVVAAARTTAARLACVSQASRRDWQQVGVRVDQVLRNGVPERVAPAVGVSAQALIAGRISPEKGTHVGIRVARRAGLGVLVVGEIYDPTYFKRDVEPLLRAGEFRGPVPRARLFELMAGAALLLMPIRWEEPFGLVAAEAQMAGCPVAAYRRGALPEVVAEGVGGYLAEPDNEAALLAACRRALSLDRRVIASRARLELGAEAMVDDYERVLKGLAATGRSRALDRTG